MQFHYTEEDDSIWQYQSIKKIIKPKLVTAVRSSFIAQEPPCLKRSAKTQARKSVCQNMHKKKVNIKSADWKDISGFAKCRTHKNDDKTEFCPFCQMPFTALKVKSPGRHVTDCMDIPLVAAEECPAGLVCEDMTSSHYRRFRHTLLANLRAGVTLADNQDGRGGAVEASTPDDGLDHAKRKLQFSSSKKLLVSMPAASESRAQPVAALGCAAQEPSPQADLSVDQAKKKLSFSVKKGPPPCEPASSNVLECENSVPEILVNDMKFNVDLGECKGENQTGCEVTGARKRQCSNAHSYKAVTNPVSPSAKRRCSEEHKASDDNITAACDQTSVEGNDLCSSSKINVPRGNRSDDDMFGEDSGDDDFFRDVAGMLTDGECVSDAHLLSLGATVRGEEMSETTAIKFGLVVDSQENYSSSQSSSQANDAECNSLQEGTRDFVASPRRKTSMSKPPIKKDSTQTSISAYFRPKYVRKSATAPNLVDSKLGSSLKSTYVHASTSFTSATSSTTGNTVHNLLRAVNDNSGSDATPVTRSRSAPRRLDQSEASSTGSSTGFSVSNNVEEAPSSGYQRKCPFYKKMPGTPFTVDAFRYGSVPGCRAYFLTHFHYDHYGGLRKSFAHPIYCSKETANLVEKKIKVHRQYLNPIALDTPTVIEGVEVTLMDANHCPGSVMILFKLKDGRAYLHTGDFRATAAMEDYPALAAVRISQLYLDTTYCDPSYSFPPQDDVIRFAVNTVADFLHEHPNALIAVGSYTIGKERIFLAIAESLNCRVCVAREKKNTLDCLEDERINKRLTLVRDEARVHVMPMKDLNCEALTSYLDKLKPQFDCVLAFEPTGWTHSNKVPSLDNLKPKLKKDRVTLYGVPYSEHSSYTEMKQFCQFIKAQQILPTVNNGSAHARRKMETLFKSWMAETPSKALKQQKLGAWFSAK